MKIIIVGGGIASLSLYLHLKKHLPSFSAHTITIYESHKPRAAIPTTTESASDSALNLADLSSSTALVGGGLGLSPNGVRVLSDLDPTIAQTVKARGFVCEKYTFKTARGHTLVKQNTSDQKEVPEYTLSISRHALWESLRERVPDEVVVFRKVVRVDDGEGQAVVFFEDGGSEEADLVIGADGVRSVVREGLFGDEERFKPTYEELCGIGSFVTMDIPEVLTTDKSMVFTFGPTGFFGYAPSSQPSQRQLMWWSTWASATVPDKTSIDVADIKRDLLDRHRTWQDPIIHDIITNSEVDSIYPVWTTPELPHWGEKRAILIGDAAHALQPTTGQGSSQALEDGLTLSLLLTHFLKKTEGNCAGEALSEQDAIKLTAKALYEIRGPRVGNIRKRGRTMDKTKKSVGVVVEYMMYAFMWVLTNVPAFGKLVLGDVINDLYGWSAQREVEAYITKHGL